MSQMEAGAPMPSWAIEALAGPGFCSVTRTEQELSVVGPAELVPPETLAMRDWACFWLHGPFDFDETGILAALLNPLAKAGVGIFAVSTYDTDYILVKQANTELAIRVWRDAGHGIDGAH